jgi:hypothetical protein
MARIVAASILASVAADSITSCGADTDHLKISSIVLDADATGGPRKGHPFTITLQGEFDEAHQHGTVTGDLQLKALGIVDEPVTFDQKYAFLPGVAAGKTTITIGPFTFPRAIPGVFDFSGKITIVNEKAEPVTCLDFALHIPQILAEEEELDAAGSVCAKSADNDHITNIQSSIVDDVKTTTMDVDEDLGFVNLKVDISVKAPIVPAVVVKLTELPITLSPAIPAGQIKFVGYPSDSVQSNDVITVSGDLALFDSNKEELTCVHLDGASAVSV